MPVTIVNPSGAPLSIGIGLSVRVSTDFIGPIASGSTWSMQVLEPGTETNPALELDFQSQQHLWESTVVTERGWAISDIGASIADGHVMTTVVNLKDPGGVIIDTGTFEIPWSTDRGLGTQLDLKQGTTGGLTPEQATQLQETHDQSFLSRIIDDLTLVEITNGPTGEPVAENLQFWNFGIIVRLTAVPPELAPQTPDGDYWLPTLAVVRIYRGSDMWLRVPIHTSSKIIPFANENLVVALSALTPTQWALQLTVQVFFLPGVEGQVFRMIFP